MGLFQRADSLINAVTSVGTDRDPAEHRRPKGEDPLDLEDLDDWLEHGRFTPHIVDKPARDSVRGGFEVKVGEERPFEERLDELDVKQKLRKALKLARGTGGAGIMLVCDDAAPLDQPIDWRTFSRVKTLNVFDRWELTPADWVEDLDDEDYGEPKAYYFHPDKPGETHNRDGEPVGDRIHHSRIIPYLGREVRRARRDAYDGWGQPVPDLLQDTLKDLNAGVQAVSSSLDEFQYDVLFIDGLVDIVSGPDGGDDGKFGDLMDAVSAAKSYLNAVVLPGESSALEKRTIDYTGLLDAIGILKENLSLGTHIPLSKLFGQTPEGLSSNDETGRENYNDDLQDIREEKHDPAIERILRWLNREREKPVDLGRAAIDWAKLDEPSEREEAETEAQRAKAHQGDVQLGILSPRESKKLRYPDLVDRMDGEYDYGSARADRVAADARPKDDPAVEAADLQPERQRKQDVGYVNSSPGEEVCADCGWYQPETGTCAIVRGDIAESGWCRLWGTDVFAAGGGNADDPLE